jgi:hypothetical protein
MSQEFRTSSAPLYASHRPRFDLANSAARDIEVHADLLQSQRWVAIQAEAHLQNLLIARREYFHRRPQLIFQCRWNFAHILILLVFVVSFAFLGGVSFLAHSSRIVIQASAVDSHFDLVQGSSVQNTSNRKK